MARLQLEGLCKGWDYPVLDELDLTIEEGEFFVVVGPSGIGKTTLLRLIAGLETADAGRIVLGDRDVTALPPYRRNVAMTFESYALYPHMTVYDNIASPLHARKVNKSEIDQKVQEVAKLLQIGALLDRKPGEISGGQKQRTALGRTLVANPDCFLLDEPISHLDAKIRHELREQFHTLAALRSVATLYVTHDYSEALSLGDRIGVMGGGKLVQVGTARELFEKPSHAFVAEQLGQPGINMLKARYAEIDGRMCVEVGREGLRFSLDDPDSQLARERDDASIHLGIRPQNIRILGHGETAPDGYQSFTASIELFEPLGSMGVALTKSGGVNLRALTPPEATHSHGETVTLAVAASNFHLFDPASGRRIS